MAKHAESIFKFCCGGFYDGYRELEIFKSGDGRHATYSKSFCPKPECRDFHVTDAQMEKLERQLDISGVEDWYCHYYSSVLDGTQWEISSLGENYSGSNAFPEGFDALVTFLADEFSCKEFMVEGGYESSFPDEMQGKPGRLWSNAAFSHCDATEEGPPAFLARLIAAAQFLASAETGFELRGEVRVKALPLTALCGGEVREVPLPYWVFQRERGKVLNLIRSLTGS